MNIDINGTYVYKLVLHGEIVYIGQSTNIIQRVYSHRLDKEKDFNEVIIEEIPANDYMNLTEFKQIVKHKPKLNKDLPPIDFSLRTGRVNEVLLCLKEAGLPTDNCYDVDKPDFTVELNGRTYKLWAKAGFEKEFFSQISELIAEVE